MHYHPIEKLVCRKPGGVELKLSTIELETGEDIDQAFFDKVEMGMQSSELIRCIGNPHSIDEMFFKGSQFGVSHQSKRTQGTVLMKDYSLAFWYYGRYVFYIVSGEVTGKALYSSKPVKLVHS
jgi:outer membrane protein assembly factor BamE (lipoprotein component of BamABCDE complex)